MKQIFQTDFLFKMLILLFLKKATFSNTVDEIVWSGHKD